MDSKPKHIDYAARAELAAKAWQHLVCGEHVVAEAVFDNLIVEDPTYSVGLRARGIARILRRDYEAARADIVRLRDRPGPLRTPECLVGVTFWLSKEREIACQEWNKETERMLNREITNGPGNAIQ